MLLFKRREYYHRNQHTWRRQSRFSRKNEFILRRISNGRKTSFEFVQSPYWFPFSKISGVFSPHTIALRHQKKRWNRILVNLISWKKTSTLFAQFVFAPCPERSESPKSYTSIVLCERSNAILCLISEHANQMSSCLSYIILKKKCFCERRQTKPTWFSIRCSNFLSTNLAYRTSVFLQRSSLKCKGKCFRFFRALSCTSCDLMFFHSKYKNYWEVIFKRQMRTFCEVTSVAHEPPISFLSFRFRLT